MTSLKVHIIHVGSMNNKGTQGLLKSDISVIRDVVTGDVAFSVSTTDVEGVKRLNLPLDAIFPPMVDIPYERADFFARKFGYERRSRKYKAFALASLIVMFFQMALSIFSAVMVRIGLKGFFRSEVLENVKKCDLVVSYSNENFKEGSSFLPLNVYWILTWWTMLISKTWDVLISKYYGKPIVMFPNSVGPFKTVIGRCLSRLALNSCNLILVREPFSYKTVESLGVRTPKILTFDTTWLLDSSSNSTFKEDSGPRVGVSPGIYSYVFTDEEMQKHVISYAEALDKAVEKFGFSVILLPHYISGFEYDDLEFSKMIMRSMKNKEHVVIVGVKTVDEFKSFLDKMDMVISSKLHPSVFALEERVPTLCIAYDHKQTSLFERLGMSKCVIPVHELSEKRLFSKICYVWDHRERLRTMLDENVPSIRKNIKKTIKSSLSQFFEESTCS